MLLNISDMPADACLRVHAIEPAAGPETAEHIVSSVEKLLKQFIAEDALISAAVDCQEAGRFLVMTWQQGPGEGLSGCRKDKLGKLLQKLENDHGCCIISSPPMVVESDQGIVCCDRNALRPQVASGKISQDSLMWDLRCEKLGDWRNQARKPIRDSWMAAILARMWQGTNG